MSRISLALFIAVLLSLVANISLAQNYTSSLIPGTEGIGISNFLAEMIIVNERWSIDLFRAYFENSLIITLILIILLIISMVFTKKNRSLGYYSSNIR